jgi:hypothetical protein
MEPTYITKKELLECVNEKLKDIKVKDLKWLYNYFHDFEEWPIVVDEHPNQPRRDASGV